MSISFIIKKYSSFNVAESSGWITKIDPYGWFKWYYRFYLGRRSSDDERQIKRWLNACGPNGRFKITLIRKILKAKSSYNDFTIGPSIRQGMLHWSYELTKKDYIDYIKNIK